MARTSIATDDFNRTDGAIGSSWLYIRNTAWQGNPPNIFSNKVFGRATGDQYQVARWAGTGTFANDQYAKATVGTLAAQTADYRCGVVARCSADIDTTADYYGYNLYSDSGTGIYTTVLFKVVNGTYTALNTAAVAWANGDTIEIEVEGTTVRGLKNGVQTVSVTDSDLTSGKPGLLVAGDNGGTVASLDNWEGGDLSSGGTSATATGATLTATATLTPGSASGQSAGTAAGVTLTGTSSLTAGSASGVSTGTITTPVLKNNTGTVLANETGVTVNVYHLTTGALVVQKTGLTSSSLGVVTVSDVLIVPGTTYAYEVKLTSNGRRLPVSVAA
jgi:hypothetical protein